MKTKYTLEKENDGWRCRSNVIDSGFSVLAKTASLAIKKMDKAIDDFNVLCSHVCGDCNQKRCRYCKEGRISRGNELCQKTTK